MTSADVDEIIKLRHGDPPNFEKEPLMNWRAIRDKT